MNELYASGIFLDKKIDLNIIDLIFGKINNDKENIKSFGILSSVRLDLQRSLFGFDEKNLVEYKDSNGEKIVIDKDEYNILEVLSQNQGKVLTYAAIIRKIWGPTDDGGIKKLQVNLANIRKKLGSKPGDNKYIINELGVGYRISEENA